MAKRNVQIKLLHSDVNNRPLPTSLALGEAVVNTADGIVMFSGASQGLSSYEALIDPSIPNATGGTYFEVGSNLYNLKIRNQITEYAGLADLSGKFLSGTTEGFKLADISDLVSGSNGITVDSANDVTLGGELSQPTVFSGNLESIDFGTSDSQLSFFRVNSIQGQETYEVPGQGLTITKDPGGIQAVMDATEVNGTKGQFDLHAGNFQLQAIGDSGDTITNLYSSNNAFTLNSIDNINNSSAYFNLANNGTASLGVQGSGSTISSGLELDDTAGGNGLRFIDGRENGAGLEYGADYSANFTDRSLVDKEFVDIAISAATLTTGNGITVSSGNTIDLGGTLNSSGTIIAGATANGSALLLGNNVANENLGFLGVFSQTVQIDSLTTYDGTGVGTLFGVNPGGFYTTNNVVTGVSSQLNVNGGGSFLSYANNTKFSLFLSDAVGGGESFTINGTTFTEGVDFIGQGDAILDATTIAGLNYSGVTDFVSVDYTPGDAVYFTFANPATVSTTITNGTLQEYEYSSQIFANSYAAVMQNGNTSLAINEANGTIFGDGSATPKGIQYGADYSATYTNRSLVDKEYVDNAISALDAQDTFVTGATYDNGSANITFTNNDGSTFDVDMSSVDLNDTVVTGATEIDGIVYFDTNDSASAFTADLTSLITNGNGTTANGTSVDLGGALTSDVIIDGVSGTTSMYIGNYGPNTQLNSFSVGTKGGGFSLMHYNEIGFPVASMGMGDGSINLIHSGSDGHVGVGSIFGNLNLGAGKTFSITTSAATVTTSNGEGLVYADDYSTGFTTNSLITKKYVDDEIAALDAQDTFVTGGTVSYTNEDGVITFTNNDGTTFDVTGITDVQTTGATLVGSTATFTQNDGTTFDLDLSALDVNDTFVTGFTYDNANTLTISMNEGQPDLTVDISTFTGVTISTLDANSVIFTDASGKLTTESNFSYDTTTDTMTVGNITVQNGTGSTATFGQGGVVIGSDGLGDLTVHGDLVVLGDTTTISTSELKVEDATITINSSTGSTNTTSLGAGVEIQDGDGAGNDVYLKIEELNTAYPSEYTALTGAENRALYTNLHDIIVRQEVDASSPTGEQVGKRVLVEGDALDAGTY